MDEVLQTTTYLEAKLKEDFYENGLCLISKGTTYQVRNLNLDIIPEGLHEVIGMGWRVFLRSELFDWSKVTETTTKEVCKMGCVIKSP